MLALKILTPKVIKAIMNYVFDKNTLDHQMEAVIEKIENKGTQISMILERIRKLEENSHPIRDFVVCDKCKQQIKEKKK